MRHSIAASRKRTGGGTGAAVLCGVVFLIGTVLAVICVRFVTDRGCEIVAEYLTGFAHRGFFFRLICGLAFGAVYFICGFFLFGFVLCPAALLFQALSFSFAVGCVFRSLESISFFSKLLFFLPKTLLVLPTSCLLCFCALGSSVSLLSSAVGAGDVTECRPMLRAGALYFLCVLLNCLIFPLLCKLLD